MRYVDGFLLVVPKNKLKEYKKIATKAGKVWKKHGALEYVESAGEDMQTAEQWGVIPFPKAASAKSGEVVIFSFIVFKSRKHRDAVNAKVMKDPYMNPDNQKNKEMPFDMKRMSYGGFDILVDL